MGNGSKAMKLTISMATFDDYDGVYFTVQALRMYHDLGDVEILILDNHPLGPCGAALRQFTAQVPQCRLIEVTDRQSSFVKYDAFSHATGDVLLGLDCHVLLQPGFITALREYWEAHPESRDMISGPVVYNRLDACSVLMEPRWRGHDYGCWGDDPAGLAGGVPFDIPMQGMGCFSMRRAAWGGINPDFRAFGAEEWYVAEKVRQWGGRVRCHPRLRWVHRFGWPVRTFPLSLEGKVMNYYRGWLELYGSLEHPRLREMTAHWLTLMPEAKLQGLIARAQMPAGGGRLQTANCKLQTANCKLQTASCKLQT